MTGAARIWRPGALTPAAPRATGYGRALAQTLPIVMPGLVPGIHVFGSTRKTWMAGTSPAMTSSNAHANLECDSPYGGTGCNRAS